MQLAKAMILAAKQNGGDSVKGQLYSAEDDKGKPYYEAAKQAQLTFDQAKELFDYARSIGIEMFFSVFGLEYVKWCKAIGVNYYKLACDCKDDVLIDAVMQTGKPFLRSLSEFYPCVGQILYCVPEYPASLLHIHMPLFQSSEFIGFSDHAIGINVAKIALARGAQIIEKHFCLDKSNCYEGEWSMTPDELRELKRWESLCHKVLA